MLPILCTYVPNFSSKTHEMCMYICMYMDSSYGVYICTYVHTAPVKVGPASGGPILRATPHLRTD